MGIAFEKLSPELQERIRQSNPDAFRKVAPAVSKPNIQRGEENQKLEGGEICFRFRITFVVLRRRLLDSHDNARSALKPLTDRITAWLGFKSDDDESLIWEYEQFKTTGTDGVLIKIEAEAIKLKCLLR